MKNYLDLGNESFDNGNMSEAVINFNSAYELAKLDFTNENLIYRTTLAGLIVAKIKNEDGSLLPKLVLDYFDFESLDVVEYGLYSDIIDYYNKYGNELSRMFRYSYLNASDGSKGGLDLLKGNNKQASQDFINWSILLRKSEISRNQNNYKEAEKHLKRAYQIAQAFLKNYPKLYFDNVIAYASVLSNNEHTRKKAAQLYKEAIPLIEIGYNHLEIFKNLSFLLLNENNNRPEAIKYFDEYIHLYESLPVDNRPDYGDYLLAQATFYDRVDKEKSGKKYIELLNYIESLSGKDSKYYYYSFYYSNYLKSIGEFDLARQKLNSCISFYRENGELQSLGFMQRVLALDYWNEEKFIESIALTKEAIKNFELGSGNSMSYTSCLFRGHLASNYATIGDYKAGKEIINEALNWSIENLQENSDLLASIYYSAGEVLVSLEQYDKAIFYLERAIEIEEKNNGHASLSGYTNLSMAYYRSANIVASKKIINKAEKSLETTQDEFDFYLGVFSILKETLNQNDLIKLTSKFKKIIDSSELSNDRLYDRISRLSSILYNIGDYESAYKYCEKALSVCPKELRNKYNYFSLLNLKITIGRYPLKKPREELIAQMNELKNCLSNLSNHQQEARINFLHLDAKLKLDDKNYKLALSSIDEAIDLYEVVISKDGSNLLNTKSHILREMGDIEMSAKLYKQQIKIHNDYLEKELLFASENEKKALINNSRYKSALFQSLAVNVFKDNPSYLDEVYKNTLLLNGIVLSSTVNFFDNLKELNSTDVNSKLEDYKAIKKKIAFEKLNNNPDLDTSLNELYLQLKAIEIDLISYNNNNLPIVNSDLSTQKIRNNLDENSVSIQFSHFKYYDLKNHTDSTLYVAYVLKKTWETPKVIPLFEEQELKTILKNTSPKTLYSARVSIGGNSSNTTTSNRDVLYKLIYKPIESYLNDIDTIYFSTDGLLHQIALSALALQGEPTLAAKYKLVQLNNMTQLVDGFKNPQLNSTMLYGGINYNFITRDNILSNSSLIKPLRISNENGPRSTNFDDEPWAYLEGTKVEVEHLKDFLFSNKIEAKLLSSSDATEASFKKLSGSSPKIIHLATHGFFYENSAIEYLGNENLSEVTNVYMASKDPLLRSGLLMSGANYAWVNGSNPYEEEDGILTALEISNLDLSNTDVVILSACETGLGDIEGSEGVYGLQRAFKKAGVDNLIMSLWEVGDDFATLFMTRLYDNWIEIGNLREAFITTQRYYIEHEKYKNYPDLWAAFVLLN
ncbi:CHAT domain-containing protein [Psychroserpens sp. MEBiC05023]